MNLSSPFINRPIGTSLLAIGIAIAGFVGFYLLPVAPLPEIDFPTVIVQSSLPGASPQTMATSVATPLESQLGQIAGVTEMTSISSLGSTRITLQFDLSRNINGAVRDVQAAINAAAANLPSNLPSAPNYFKVNPADAPIMILALTSRRYTRGQMYDVASTLLQQKLSQIDGVGQVIVGGSSLPAVRVDVNPTVLNKYGVNLTDVSTVLNTANANLAKGAIVSNQTNSIIQANDQLIHPVDYQNLVVRYQNNHPIFLKDIANVTESIQDLRTAGVLNGEPSVMLILFKSPGANVVQTLEAVRSALPQLNADIPAGMKMNIAMDRIATIKAALSDVEMTLVIAMILVVLITYLFLGHIHAMLIPGMVVPLSLLGTFGVMLLLGYSLDNLSLMALTISTGLVVDDAVVVLENIMRHVENGLTPMKAAFLGAQEVGFTVLSMSLSLIAVFLPILLMGGMLGRLFREFSMTLSIAILISMFVSLTITPTMCARLLKPTKAVGEEDKGHIVTVLFVRLRHYYERSLQWALAHTRLMFAIMLLTIVLTISLFIIVPKGFFPQQDTGRITGSLQADQHISFPALQTMLFRYVNIIKQDPGVADVVGYVGGASVNSGSMYISLKPLDVRHVSADVIINRLRSKLAKVSGGKLYLQSAQDLLVGGKQTNAQFQYTLSADSLTLLNQYTPLIVQQLKKIHGIADVNSNERDNGLQEMVMVNKDAAARYGITMQQIDSTLYHAFGQALVSTIYTSMNQYYVVMEVAPKYWQYPETLNDINIVSPTGASVPLSALAHFVPSKTLLMVNHEGQQPAVTLSFNLLPGVALGDAVNAVQAAVENMHLPNTIQTTFRGTAQAFQSALSDEPYLILAALIAVYIVLGMLYENLIHPVTILSTLPSAGLGGLLALLLSHTDFSIIALIGMILLIGIVKKNAIMMIDVALHVERTEKKTPKECIYTAAVMRFRPIMMTTAAALFGALPLMIGFGQGSELRQPLGIVIVGGLIVSQMLTLYTTPIIYLMMEKLRSRFKRKPKGVT